ncbi:hypothetical protein BDP27DRAFT_466341 [Rhodocollybia butyracea]|uniref:Mid2 domain-containing protein n=1 Tax=Rhodocollybia butyracea TaxID=206335 RepID=A0A9P5TZK0_9AGAR|nr:hypothetical protein BDP27DRAFT_466341 [Rhodocollybia butyracea]
MIHLIYRLLVAVALWTSYTHCQLTLYQANTDVFGLASATFQEVGVADGATTYIHVAGDATDTFTQIMVVSASGFSEDTGDALLGSIALGGCQFVAATSVSCDIDDGFGNVAIVGTPLAFEVAVETMLVTSQSPGASASSSILTPQSASTFPSPTPASSVTASSTIGEPMPSLSTSIPSSAMGTLTPSPVVSTGSNGAPKKPKSLAAVIGGVVGGIILLLSTLICWFVHRKRAKQAYLKATRPTKFGTSKYNGNSIPSASANPPHSKQNQVISEGDQNRAAFQQKVAEELSGRVISVETSNSGTLFQWSTLSVRGRPTSWYGEKKN